LKKNHEKEVARHLRRTGHSLKYFKVCVFRTELFVVQEYSSSEHGSSPNTILNVSKRENKENLIF